MLPCWVVDVVAGAGAAACWSRSARRRASSRASCRRTFFAWAERNPLDRSSSVQVARAPPSISPVAGSAVTRRSDAFFLAGARAASSAAWAMALACWVCAAAPESTASAAAADREPAAGSSPMAREGDTGAAPVDCKISSSGDSIARLAALSASRWACTAARCCARAAAPSGGADCGTSGSPPSSCCSCDMRASNSRRTASRPGFGTGASGSAAAPGAGAAAASGVPATSGAAC